MKTKLETTPAIPAGNIRSQKYLGPIELDEGGETHLVKIETPHGSYLVAGGACNAGLLPDYARKVEDGETLDESLQDFVQDLQAGDYPSGELLAWHGSLVI